MPARSLIAWSTAARLVAALIACAATVEGQARFEGEIDGIYRRGGYARDLPGRAPTPDPIPPERRKVARGDDLPAKDYPARTPREVRPPAPRDPSAASQILRWLPWVVVGIGVVVLTVAAVRHRKSLARKRPQPPAAVEPPVTPLAGTPPLAVAEALAREGRHAEAIHALLLAAIERVRSSAPLAASLTSRELSSAATLAPEGKAALLELVRAVELTLFGGRAAGAAEFEACSAALRRIPA
jgi:hypothetical protein